GVAIPSGVTALLGITEPAMFGVNLKLRYPFIAAICGAALASAFITLFNVKAQALGAAGLPGIISINPQQIGYYIMGMAISFVAAFALTVLLAMREKTKQAAQVTA
ncbi:TPA: PTS maltose transporter subunit IIBC, partial [Vibrio cholerae]|nr:PTS maltose transporter subunit IIBC [Vibrio cholerae]